MSLLERIIIIAVVVLGTMLTRFLPFIVFNSEKSIPTYVQYLGRVLPPATFGMLVVYALRKTKITGGNYGLPELLSILVIIALHAWRKSMLLSIAGGTIVYMFFVLLVFFSKKVIVLGYTIFYKYFYSILVIILY